MSATSMRTGFDLGPVNIHGDLGAIDAGDAIASTPGLAKLTAQSLGVLGLTTGATDLHSDIAGSLGSLTLLTNVQNAAVAVTGATAKLGSVNIGGTIIGE